jgi:hypothetical protein
MYYNKARLAPNSERKLAVDMSGIIADFTIRGFIASVARIFSLQNTHEVMYFDTICIVTYVM